MGSHESYMRMALDEAAKAKTRLNPWLVVVVRDGEVVAKAIT